LTYAALVDSATENLWLESWLAWTNKAVQPTPFWYEELPDAIGRFGSDVFLANFAALYPELEWALKATALATSAAATTFELHAMSVPKTTFLRGDQFYRNAYGTPRARATQEEWARWCKHCYAWIYESAKCVNWLADVVRRDLNPMFFATEGKFGIYEDNLESAHRLLRLEYEASERTVERPAILRGLVDRDEAPTYDFLEREFAEH
jgi:hypothetical protein